MGTLTALVAAAKNRISERGELPYPVRAELRAALVAEGGRVAWARLERLAALHVKDLWARRFPSEDGPWRLLEEAVASLESGRPAPPDWWIGHWWSFLDSEMEGATDFGPMEAGYAALAAALSTQSDADPFEAESELDLDPWAYDACFWASVAASGDATWGDDAGDHEARRAFWQWYLGVVENALEPVSPTTT